MVKSWTLVSWLGTLLCWRLCCQLPCRGWALYSADGYRPNCCVVVGQFALRMVDLANCRVVVGQFTLPAVVFVHGRWTAVCSTGLGRSSNGRPSLGSLAVRLLGVANGRPSLGSLAGRSPGQLGTEPCVPPQRLCRYRASTARREHAARQSPARRQLELCGAHGLFVPGRCTAVWALVGLRSSRQPRRHGC